VISVTHVSVVDAFSDKVGSCARYCMKLPTIPRASIIQNKISEPTSGVTIMGSSEKKITSPLRYLFSVFTASAITKPRMISSGVTVKV